MTSNNDVSWTQANIYNPSIFCSVSSTPVGVQCPSLPHKVSFQAIGLWYPGLSPALVSIAFSFPFHISVFFHSPFWSAIEFHSCFFLRLLYLHPSVDPSLTHFLDAFPGFGTGYGTRCCGQRGQSCTDIVFCRLYRYQVEPIIQQLISITRPIITPIMRSRLETDVLTKNPRKLPI